MLCMDDNPYQSPQEPPIAAKGDVWPIMVVVALSIGLGFGIFLPIVMG